jgi:acyl-CoA thioester hydrolase
MYIQEIDIRVRYAETDQMGYVYYGNYAAYFEVARVESLRSLGFSYKALEERGILMPVLEYQTKYIRPAKYDDVLHIKTSIIQMPGTRIFFEYEVYNDERILLTKAQTTLVFIDRTTNKPRLAPPDFLDQLRPFFDQ